MGVSAKETMIWLSRATPPGKLDELAPAVARSVLALFAGTRLDVDWLGHQDATSPLWVWITVGLLAIGTLAYFAAAALAEYLMLGL